MLSAVLLLALLGLALSQNSADRRTSPFPSSRDSVPPPALVGWSFQFLLRPIANGSGVVVVGSEYFSLAEERVRRDWAQGASTYEGCPLPAEAGGNELVDLAPSGSQHLLVLDGGEWKCTEQRPVPPSTPRPSGSLLQQGERGTNLTLIRDILAFPLYGYGLSRPGPACPSDPAGNWTAWLSVASDALLQLDTSCFVLEVYAWRGPPARIAGSQYGPLSVPLVCPVDLPPQPVGYALAGLPLCFFFLTDYSLQPFIQFLLLNLFLAAGMILFLFFGILTIRK
jgi:hypothetical protein